MEGNPPPLRRSAKRLSRIAFFIPGISACDWQADGTNPRKCPVAAQPYKHPLPLLGALPATATSLSGPRRGEATYVCVPEKGSGQPLHSRTQRSST